MSIRAKFPYFNNNKDEVYLDTAATSQKPLQVIDAMNTYYVAQNSTVHRSNHSNANSSTKDYEQARETVAQFINAQSSQHIVWTKGATDSLNTISQAWAKNNLLENDLIVVLGSEHHANFVPWQQLAKAQNLRFEVVRVSSDGGPDFEHYKILMAQKPKLVCLQHCSNALGNIHPVEELTRLAKEVDAIVVVDGAQAVSHIPVDVQKIGCDFYVFSGHKLYGPNGIGVLFYSPTVKSGISAVQFGGEMVIKVSIEDTVFRPLPSLLETGTPNVAGVIGLAAAINFIQEPESKLAIKNEPDVYQYLVQQIKTIDKVKIYGDTSNNIGVLSFTVNGESLSDIATMMSEQKVAMRFGHHCAMPLMTALNLDGTARVSLGMYSTKADVDNFITALKSTITFLDI